MAARVVYPFEKWADDAGYAFYKKCNCNNLPQFKFRHRSKKGSWLFVYFKRGDFQITEMGRIKLRGTIIKLEEVLNVS